MAVNKERRQYTSLAVTDSRGDSDRSFDGFNMKDDLKGSRFCKKIHVASGDSKIGKREKLSNCNESITAF